MSAGDAWNRSENALEFRDSGAAKERRFDDVHAAVGRFVVQRPVLGHLPAVTPRRRQRKRVALLGNQQPTFQQVALATLAVLRDAVVKLVSITEDTIVGGEGGVRTGTMSVQ